MVWITFKSYPQFFVCICVGKWYIVASLWEEVGNKKYANR